MFALAAYNRWLLFTGDREGRVDCMPKCSKLLYFSWRGMPSDYSNTTKPQALKVGCEINLGHMKNPQSHTDNIVLTMEISRIKETLNVFFCPIGSEILLYLRSWLSHLSGSYPSPAILNCTAAIVCKRRVSSGL